MRSPPYLLFAKARSKQKLAKENPFPAGHPADKLFLWNLACSKVILCTLPCILHTHLALQKIIFAHPTDISKYKFSVIQFFRKLFFRIRLRKITELRFDPLGG